MLEILFVVFLCKSLGKIAREKGRSATGYQWMLVGLWIAGELLGGVVGVVALGNGNITGAAYVMALVGAAAGATVAFVIVKNLSPLNEERQRGFPM